MAKNMPSICSAAKWLQEKLKCHSITSKCCHMYSSFGPQRERWHSLHASGPHLPGSLPSKLGLYHKQASGLSLAQWIMLPATVLRRVSRSAIESRFLREATETAQTSALYVISSGPTWENTGNPMAPCLLNPVKSSHRHS